jgi:HrpA-like RNA helicase
MYRWDYLVLATWAVYMFSYTPCRRCRGQPRLCVQQSTASISCCWPFHFLLVGRRSSIRPGLSRQLLQEQRNKEANSAKYLSMQQQRATLPIAAHRQQLLEAISSSQVRLLSKPQQPVWQRGRS